ncbi:hypothetical protein KM043_014251 [Ampulex compressa]|nr:hypothetical protein KM043_014251 [Ampulex compressa]
MNDRVGQRHDAGREAKERGKKPKGNKKGRRIESAGTRGTRHHHLDNPLDLMYLPTAHFWATKTTCTAPTVNEMRSSKMYSHHGGKAVRENIHGWVKCVTAFWGEGVSKYPELPA